MTDTASSRPLSGQVALVAGATRGAGRGIARALGEAGAIVYCSGRSTAGALASGPRRTETIEETAAMVTAAGGEGIAARTDHFDVAEVEALVARIRKEQGRLDVLVNDIWGGDATTEWGVPLWELDVSKAAALVSRAVFTHLITTRYAVPLMRERKRGLIVEVTDGDALYYRGNLPYDLAKTSVMRLAWSSAQELLPEGITALAVTPGFLRSEAMLDHFGVTAESWRDGVERDPHFIASESPLFVGRAVAALAADPDVQRKAGGTYASWTLSDEYGFTDEDGSRPHWGKHFDEHVKEGFFPRRTAWTWRLTRAAVRAKKPPVVPSERSDEEPA